MSIESNLTPCSIHNEPRYFDSTGHIRCRSCKNASTRKRYKIHREKILLRTKEIRHPLYATWNSMNQRCYNPNAQSYPSYGALGIFVYEPWRQLGGGQIVKTENRIRFARFKEYIDQNLGPKPDETYSLDRLDGKTGYLPDNLKWSSPTEQTNNRRTSKSKRTSIPDESPMYYPYGKLTTLKEFSEIINLPLIIVKYRYSQNWDAEWIIEGENDNRYYEYQGHHYNLAELSLLSGVAYHNIQSRLHNLGWSVDRTVNTP